MADDPKPQPDDQPDLGELGLVSFSGPLGAVIAVARANAAFYEAFERRDFDAMSDTWEHADRVVCTHPGWPTLRGWAKVSASWIALLQNGQRLQFILTNVSVVVNGDSAWITCDENILDTSASSTVTALNVFVRAPHSRTGWVMVGHHGSLVHASLV